MTDVDWNALQDDFDRIWSDDPWTPPSLAQFVRTPPRFPTRAVRDRRNGLLAATELLRSAVRRRLGR